MMTKIYLKTIFVLLVLSIILILQFQLAPDFKNLVEKNVLFVFVFAFIYSDEHHMFTGLIIYLHLLNLDIYIFGAQLFVVKRFIPS